LTKNYFMATIQKSRYKILTLLLWAILIYSGMALIYHIRWFIPYLVKNQSAVVPEKQVPLIWFIVQICNNSAFIYIGWQLIRLFRKYNLTGYFDKESLKVFKTTIVLCIVLAITGAVQTVAANFNEVHFNEWNSAESIANLFFRSFTLLLVLHEPQSLFILLALMLFAVREFVIRAIYIKNENESFI